MPNNTRRPTYRNRLSVATLTAAILLCVTFAGAFITFVVSRNRLAALADEQRRVEQEITLFHQEIQALKKRIDTSLTRDKVHDRLASGGTYLKPIEPASIITLSLLDSPQTAQAEPAPSSAATVAHTETSQATAP